MAVITGRATCWLPPSTSVGGRRSRCPGRGRRPTVAEFLADRPAAVRLRHPAAGAAGAASWTRTSPGWPSGAASRGVELAPHGKTTMAPGAVAAAARAPAPGASPSPPGRSCGWRSPPGCARVQLANALVDPVGAGLAAPGARRRPRAGGAGLGRLRRHRRRDGGRRSPAPAARPLTRAGRAGRRRRPHRRPRPGHRAAPSPTPSTRARVLRAGRGRRLRGRARARHHARRARRGARPTCSELADAARRARIGAYPAAVVVTAGGSAYFDEVAEVLAPAGRRPDADGGAALGRLRRSTTTASTAAISPFSRARRAGTARVGDARVGPGGLPARAGAGPARRRQARRPVRRGAARAAAGRRPRSARRRGRSTGEITAVNDQHAFLRLDPADPLRVGRRRAAGPVAPVHGVRQVALDPGAPTAPGDDPVVVELVRTYF